MRRRGSRSNRREGQSRRAEAKPAQRPQECQRPRGLLAAFVSSVIFAWIAGVALDAMGRGFLSVAAVNLARFVAIFAVAQGAARLKLARALRAPTFAAASTFVRDERASLRSQASRIGETAT